MMRAFLAAALVLASSALGAGEIDASAVRGAVQKSIPWMQRTGPAFWAGSGCISCHNNTLPDMAVTIAQARGFHIDEAALVASTKQTHDFLDLRRERLLEGLAPGGGQNTLGSLLFTMAKQGVPRSPVTDAGARYQKILQTEDGSWPVANHRPPLVSSTVTLTAMSLLGLRAYAPPAQKSRYDESVARAVAWLAKAQPRNTEDSAFKILGLAGTRGTRAVVAQTAELLVQTQHPDGGWSQLPSLDSDAYATGQALVALNEAGFGPRSPVVARGVAFLVQTQQPDGTWHVKTRSEPTQDYFEAGYPYGVDQFVSAAGGAWATAALALTQPPAH